MTDINTRSVLVPLKAGFIRIVLFLFSAVFLSIQWPAAESGLIYAGQRNTGEKPDGTAHVPGDSAQSAADISFPGPADDPGADRTGPVPADSAREPVSHNPRALRYNGIYLTSNVAANTGLLKAVIARCRETVISGLVIDMKDDNGRFAYRSRLPLAGLIGSNTRRMADPRQTVSLLHQNGLIACARVVCFKDPRLALYAGPDSTYPYAVIDSSTGLPWKQKNGETWANPYDERVHDYLIGLVDELVSFGFDQVQLDYIRFPTDGEMSMILYPVAIDSVNKADVLSLFLTRVRSRLESSGTSLAVDVFGWVP
ncbi:MAG: putative glycoside hydrolase, partial [Gemmatimonadota bacterium]|nr:putative glycoside hydrolase [Gemmatimonadota bacterium]